MATCQVCGNSYDKTFEVVKDNKKYVFDSFECAIHELAPNCAGCGIRVLGHGVEANGNIYCGAHCAEKAGVSGIKDRI